MLPASIAKFLDKVGVPELYGQESDDEKRLYMRLYLEGFSWSWYVCEADIQADDILFFGFVQGDVGEWGYFTLSELHSAMLPLIMDTDFHSMPFAEAKARYKFEAL
jgi:hypothetical protein